MKVTDLMHKKGPGFNGLLLCFGPFDNALKSQRQLGEVGGVDSESRDAGLNRMSISVD